MNTTAAPFRVADVLIHALIHVPFILFRVTPATIISHIIDFGHTSYSELLLHGCSVLTCGFCGCMASVDGLRAAAYSADSNVDGQ